MDILTGVWMDTLTDIPKRTRTLLYLMFAASSLAGLGCSYTTNTNINAELGVLSVLSAPTPAYTETRFNFFQSMSRSVTPGFSGAIPQSCTVEPALPSGLALGSDCTVSGTPTAVSASQNYAVRAAGSLGIGLSYLGLKVSALNATRVYGQAGSFTTANPATTATGLSGPYGAALDSSGGLYIAEYLGANRVLYYPSGSTTATRVYGQLGSFTSATADNGGLSADSLDNPTDVASDGSGGLYIADNNNHRVLYYASGSTTATRVYGQGGSFTSQTQNTGGRSADSLSSPTGVAVDPAGGLYIAESNNHRVLYYPAGSTTATRVYGQGGSFTTATPNLGGVSATSLFSPQKLTVDSAGGLYVADQANHRVLYFPAGQTTATRVYGQTDFTGNTANAGGLASGLNGPTGVAVSSAGEVYIADTSNHRVLYYPPNSTTPTGVYGQLGSLTTAVANTGGRGAGTLNGPADVVLDGSGGVYIMDHQNVRALYLP